MNSEKSTIQRPLWLGLLSLVIGAVAGFALWSGGFRRHGPPPEPFSRTAVDSSAKTKPSSEIRPAVETPVLPNHSDRSRERY